MSDSSNNYHKEADKCKHSCLKSKLDKEIRGIGITEGAERLHLGNEAFAANADAYENVVEEFFKTMLPKSQKLLCCADRRRSS